MTRPTQRSSPFVSRRPAPAFTLIRGLWVHEALLEISPFSPRTRASLPRRSAPYWELRLSKALLLR